MLHDIEKLLARTIYHEKGYLLVFYPTHPHVWSNGYFPVHRLVMENTLNKYLLPTEHVHHINENKLDNNPLNLQLVTNIEHHYLHRPRRKKKPCLTCGNPFTVYNLSLIHISEPTRPY